MSELLKELYDGFYEKLPAPQLRPETEQRYQKLIKQLKKLAWGMEPKTISCKDKNAENMSFDNIPFVLELGLLNELNNYETERSAPRRIAEEQGALDVPRRENSV